MEQNFENISRITEMLRTPEGKQLIAELQKSNGEDPESPLQQASHGDCRAARKLIEDFLSRNGPGNPEG